MPRPCASGRSAKGKVEVIALIDHVHDADRLPIVILDDREATSVEPLGVVAALDVEIPAVERLDVFTQRCLMKTEAELVVCAGRLTEPHPRMVGGQPPSWKRSVFPVPQGISEPSATSPVPPKISSCPHRRHGLAAVMLSPICCRYRRQAPTRPEARHGPQTIRDHGVLIMRRLIATVFNYSLDGLLADEGTDFWEFCFTARETAARRPGAPRRSPGARTRTSWAAPPTRPSPGP